MNLPRSLFLLARLIFSLFAALTSLYCLLTYIPFTYQQIHKAEVLSSVTAFVRFHPYLYWLALIAVTLTLVPDFARGKTRLLALGFLGIHVMAGIILLSRPLLSALQNDSYSFVCCLVSLVPLLWIAVIDWVGHGRELISAQCEAEEDHKLFKATWQTAFFTASLYAGISYLLHLVSTGSDIGQSQRMLAIGWSFLAHLLFFMAIFVVLNLIRAVAWLFPIPTKVEFFLCNLFIGFLVWLLVTRVVFPPISFRGSPASLFAFLAALSLISCLSGLAVRLHPPGVGSIGSGLTLALTPLTLGRISSLPARALSFLALVCGAYILAAQAAALDWNYLLQKIAVVIVWSMAFACFYAMAPRRTGAPRGSALLLLAAVLTLGVFKTLQASVPRWWKGNSDPETVFDRYAGYDVSFRMVRDILRPTTVGIPFYQFLNENTNIPRSIHIDPVEISLVDKLTETDREKPHIFIFVIDSLRRDYLSPYNRKVTFTPSIEGFAQESIAMRNAFTRYGGTGLSEPSIWVGGMLLHQQYITPFAPMNTLQKLMEANKYQLLISRDSILNTIVLPSASVVDLDAGRANMNYDLCLTLKELEDRIKRRGNAAEPVFAYTQPQNLHVSVINREGPEVPDRESYPGFHAPYAFRVNRLDSCFGQFIGFLKEQGLYDDCIVILTADHGDSLGEEGRWGHAYTIFPEIIRIPLIIHLPKRLRDGLSVDPDALAFLTDITPTLYYLLGRRPIVRHEIFGQPLFTVSPSERTAYQRDSYLIASSYAAVYGVLRDRGRRLYISDGVNYRDHFFEMTENAAGISGPVTSSMKTENEELIRDHILEINRFYRFRQSPEN